MYSFWSQPVAKTNSIYMYVAIANLAVLRSALSSVICCITFCTFFSNFERTLKFSFKGWLWSHGIWCFCVHSYPLSQGINVHYQSMGYGVLCTFLPFIAGINVYYESMGYSVLLHTFLPLITDKLDLFTWFCKQCINKT